MAKQPSLQTNTANWLSDRKLRSCSAGARGLWQDMRCLMFESEKFGLLILNGKATTAIQLARIVGESYDDVKAWLDELGDAGVFTYDAATGAIFDRDLVREGAVRAARRESGTQGGRPAKNQNTDFGFGLVSEGGKGGEDFTSGERGERKGGPGENHRGDHETKTETKPSRVPDPFTVDPADAAKLLACGAKSDFLDWHTQKFVDYWRAVPGRKGFKADWRATWRNWMMTELERSNGPKGPGGNRGGGGPAHASTRDDKYSAEAIAKRRQRGE